MRTPSSRSVRMAWMACAGSCIRWLSVISSSISSGETPASAISARMRAARSGWRNCRAERLTAIGTGRALAAGEALGAAPARPSRPPPTRTETPPPSSHWTDPDDEAALLEHVDELGRWHRPPLRMGPAQQRLATARPHREEVELGLVGEREFLALERPAQIRAEQRARPGALVDLGGEELVG